MPDAAVRLNLGDLSCLVAVEDVDAVNAELLLTLRTSAVAGMEDLVRSPELRDLIVDGDGEESDIAPEDVAGAAGDDPPSA